MHWRKPRLDWAWAATSSWWTALRWLQQTQVAQSAGSAQSNAPATPRFREGIGKFAALALLGRLAPDEIEAEATAQIRKLQASGIAVTHLDSHKHTHIFPRVLQAALARGEEPAASRAIRNPFERIQGSQLAAHPACGGDGLRLEFCAVWQSNSAKRCSKPEYATPDGTLAIVATGSLNERLLRLMIEHLPDGTWELVCHPGYNDADLQGIHTRLRESREQELRILTSQSTRDLLSANGVEIISFRELIAAG